MNNQDKYSYCHVAQRTDVGCKRKANEDWLTNFVCDNGLVAVVCDGMGGHVGGATASHLAIDTIQAFLSAHYYDDPHTAIVEACNAANNALLQHTQQHPELTGMGATCVMLIVRDGKVYIGSIGDSRIYLIRKGNITQLTKDQSYVQMLVDMGQLAAEDMESHPRKNEITNALGFAEMQPATVLQGCIAPQAGDCFLLCSDGLSGMVKNAAIADVVRRQAEFSQQQRVDTLVQMARNNGGVDNITCQIVEFSVTPGTPVQPTPPVFKGNRRNSPAPDPVPDTLPQPATATADAPRKSILPLALGALGVLVAAIGAIAFFLLRDTTPPPEHSQQVEKFITQADTVVNLGVIDYKYAAHGENEVLRLEEDTDYGQLKVHVNNTDSTRVAFNQPLQIESLEVFPPGAVEVHNDADMTHSRIAFNDKFKFDGDETELALNFKRGASKVVFLLKVVNKQAEQKKEESGFWSFIKGSDSKKDAKAQPKKKEKPAAAPKKNEGEHATDGSKAVNDGDKTADKKDDKAADKKEKEKEHPTEKAAEKPDTTKR